MKVLFTTPILEHPAAGGSQLRIENSIIALNRISDLHIISRVDRNKLGGEASEFFYKQHCKRFEYIPSKKPLNKNRYIRKVQKIIRKKYLSNDTDFILKYAIRHKIEVIWFGYGNISFDLIKTIKEKRPSFKIVCDSDSVWSRFILRELPYEIDSIRKIEIENKGKQKQEEEKQWVNLCDVSTAVSEVDASYYRELAKYPDRIKIFSNVIDLNTYKNKVDPPEAFYKPCMYLAGTFWPKSPMEKAARWVIKEVLPIVKKRIPDLHFYIVGNGSKEVLNDINDNHVTITGKLNSVLPYLFNADVALVPLTFESGTRFKILEAAACGTPIVSTKLGAEGIPVKHGYDIIIADTPHEFGDGIANIISNKEFSQMLAANCKKLVHEAYSIESLQEEANGILEYLTSKMDLQAE